MSKLSDAQIDELVRLVGEGGVATQPHILDLYGRDWTHVHAPNPSAVCFPANTHEASQLVKFAYQNKIAIVPSGGRTGLAGGAVAMAGEVVISLERLSGMDEVDQVGNTVRVGAGVITQALHDYVAEADLQWPIDFASKGSSTIGGNIATNAGGVRVVRYGLTREWVMGLEVVTGTGEIMTPGGPLVKNNTGLDLRQLFIGSEGVLGLITAATLKLIRLPQERSVFLLTTSSLEKVLQVYALTERKNMALSAFEVFSRQSLARLLKHRGLDYPLEVTAYGLIVEFEDASPDRLEAWFSELLDGELIEDGVRSSSAAQAAKLWEYREGISESLSATGLPHKNDISLPIASLVNFSLAFETLIAQNYPNYEVCIFGHIGDGNLHVNVMKPDTMDAEAFWRTTKSCDEDLFGLVAKYGGSISAEHGIGLLKKAHLHFTRSAEEIAAMRSIKQIFDPAGIMNPGKIF